MSHPVLKSMFDEKFIFDPENPNLGIKELRKRVFKFTNTEDRESLARFMTPAVFNDSLRTENYEKSYIPYGEDLIEWRSNHIFNMSVYFYDRDCTNNEMRIFGPMRFRNTQGEEYFSTGIKELDLRGCTLYRDTFLNLKQLESLTLSECIITDPNCFQYLTNLKFLSVSRPVNSRFLGLERSSALGRYPSGADLSFDVDSLNGLNRLEEVIFQMLKLNGSLNSIPNVKYINLNAVHLENVHLDSVHENIREITMEKCTGLTSAFTQGMEGLLKIELNDVSINDSTYLFTNLNSIESIHMRFCENVPSNFNILSGITNAITLKKLHIESYNELNVDEFENLVNLEELFLSAYTNSYPIHLPNLKNLELAHRPYNNGLKEYRVYDSRNYFSSNCLEKFSVRFHDFVDPNIFSNITTLKTIELYDCKNSDILIQALSNNNIETASLSHIQASVCYFLSRLKSLRLENANFETFQGFGYFPRLHDLTIKSPESDITDLMFDGCNNLFTLHIEDTNRCIRSLNGNIFYFLPSLYKLSLLVSSIEFIKCGPNLRSLDAQWSKNIKHIDTSSCIERPHISVRGNVIVT